MSVEFFGRLEAPALTLLDDLADQAGQAGGLGLSWAVFILGVLRKLSVALCRVNASLCRLGAYAAMRAAGRTPMRGIAQPYIGWRAFSSVSLCSNVYRWLDWAKKCLDWAWKDLERRNVPIPLEVVKTRLGRQAAACNVG
jgi:hypothetical protein